MHGFMLKDLNKFNLEDELLILYVFVINWSDAAVGKISKVELRWYELVIKVFLLAG